MSVESILTRQLNIRFIDARALCTEAKLSLGVEGYHSEDQEGPLINEAIRLFTERPAHVKAAMTRLRSDLDAIKNPPRRSHSGCSDYSQRSSSDGASVAGSDDYVLTASSEDPSSSTNKKRGSRTTMSTMWPVRRR